jgi:hypothetical protein
MHGCTSQFAAYAMEPKQPNKSCGRSARRKNRELLVVACSCTRVSRGSVDLAVTLASRVKIGSSSCGVEYVYVRASVHDG